MLYARHYQTLSQNQETYNKAFFFIENLRSSNNICIENKLSTEEYSFLKPAWFSFNTSNSSENTLKRPLRIEVKHFPMQLKIVIGL